MPLIIPENVDTEKFILNILTLSPQGEIRLVATIPQPENDIFKGLPLFKIREALQQPISALLQAAKINKSARVMFEVTELNTFNEAKIKQMTLQSLHANKHQN
jgi:hypothetical protein